MRVKPNMKLWFERKPHKMKNLRNDDEKGDSHVCHSVICSFIEPDKIR